MILELISFGFKKNNPPESNYLIDVRFLNNPYYIDELRHRTGLDPKVINFFKKDKETKNFLGKLLHWLDYLFEANKNASKEKVILAIGCTGGQHRSPYIVEWIAKELSKKKSIKKLSVYHREFKSSSAGIKAVR